MRPRHGFSVNLARHLSLSKVVTAFLFFLNATLARSCNVHEDLLF